MDNIKNNLITSDDVEKILNKFGNIGMNGEYLKIKNIIHYQKSFVHESYYQSQIQNSLDEKSIVFPYLSKESNERLEYLGDHILKAVLGRYLYERFPNEREGFLTRLKIKIEKRETLCKFANELGFRNFLLLSSQLENQTFSGNGNKGRNNPSYYEDAFESFLGAIMEDFGDLGYIYCDKFIRNILENIIDFAEIISKNDNFKDSIQRYFQINKWGTPKYITATLKTETPKDIFVRCLILTQQQFESLDKSIQINIKKFSNSQNHLDYQYLLSIGTGKKVIIAEQNAAKGALQILNLDLNY